jgi:uncharacterized protein
VQEMKIYGVSFDMVGKQPIVLLKTADGKRFLPIWIGASEASAIMSRLQGTEAPRPMTHDLLQNVVDELGGTIVRIAVTELRDNTFYAQIVLRANGDEHEIDSRPSDAIALAVRANTPIFAEEDVLSEASILIKSDEEEREVEKFREFLDQVSPEDFE